MPKFGIETCVTHKQAACKFDSNIPTIGKRVKQDQNPRSIVLIPPFNKVEREQHHFCNSSQVKFFSFDLKCFLCSPYCSSFKEKKQQLTVKESLQSFKIMSIFSHLKQKLTVFQDHEHIFSFKTISIYGNFWSKCYFLRLHLIHSSRRVYWELLNSTNHYHFEKTIALIPT